MPKIVHSRWSLSKTEALALGWMFEWLAEWSRSNLCQPEMTKFGYIVPLERVCSI